MPNGFEYYTKKLPDKYQKSDSYLKIEQDVVKWSGIVFVDKELDTILEVEATYVHAAGSFFSIDLETVNNYFVQGLLDGNKEFREQYAVM